jgi:hypothetical protein
LVLLLLLLLLLLVVPFEELGNNVGVDSKLNFRGGGDEDRGLSPLLVGGGCEGSNP